MNLGQVGTNKFLCQPVRLAAQVLEIGETQSKRSVLLSSSCPSRGDPFPPVLVMEAAENHASHNLAVLGKGMLVVVL